MRVAVTALLAPEGYTVVPLVGAGVSLLGTAITVMPTLPWSARA
jgi:hypothetical protein